MRLTPLEFTTHICSLGTEWGGGGVAGDGEIPWTQPDVSQFGSRTQHVALSCLSFPICKLSLQEAYLIVVQNEWISIKVQVPGTQSCELLKCVLNENKYIS